MFYKKSKFCSKIICLFLLFNLIFNLNVSLIAASVVPADKINKELKDKLDILRVDQVLDSVKMFQESQSIITNNEWDELELDKILENWANCKKTKFDIWGIKNLLRFAPAGSKEIVRNLVEDDAAFGQLNEFIDKVASAQESLISYWDELDVLNCQAKGLYYSVFGKYVPKVNNFLNKNEACLQTSNFLGYARPVYNILGMFNISSILINYVICKSLGFQFEGWKKSIISAIKSPIDSHNPMPCVYKNEFDYFKLVQIGSFTLGDKYIFFEHVLKDFVLGDRSFGGKKIKSVLAGTGSAILVGGWQAFIDYCLYKMVTDSVNKIMFLHKTSARLQENLVKIADMLRALNKLQTGRLGQDQESCLAIKNIEKFLKRDGASVNLNALLDKLGSYTFASKSEIVYSGGRLLSTHKLISEIKSDLIPLLQNISLLAGYRTIAQIIRDHKNSRVKFCFVDFVNNKTPIINLENAWIPLISDDKVVANNCKFGVYDSPICAVVTGPNGGGKSTLMITTAFNVLLSKLGIAAADSAVMTDFAAIRTSLRPAQDISSGLSSFMAEHKRVTTVKAAMNSCAGNILVLLDEPYKGTVEIESANRVYDFGKNVAENQSNCVLLMATHLRKPIDLEQDTHGLFKNYQMGYLEVGDYDFKRTFKVLDGPALWWFDDAGKRERFIDWLCANEIGA